MSPGGSLLLLFYGQQGGSPPSAYATLLEAVVATLRTAMVTPGDLSGVYDRIPPTLNVPYATCVEVGNSRDWTDTAGGYVDSGMIQVTVFASRKKAARTLGDSVAVLLNDADLSFDEGNLMLLRQDSRPAQADPDREPGGEPLYAEIRTFRYMISSGLS